MSNAMIHSAGAGFWHPSEFTINRPNGAGDYVFLHFLTAMELWQPTGVGVVPAGTCVLYGPADRQWFRGHGTGLGNDWFHAGGAAFAALVGRYALPLARPLRPRRTEFIAPLIAEIQAESMRTEPHGDRAAALLVEQLLLKLARALAASGDAALSPRKAELQERFQAARFRILKDFTHPWTVPEMAALVHLSASRFAPLYREFFAATPMSELIAARIERARWLLASTNLSICEVARQSGFESIYYFSRMFRRRTGTPPSHQPRPSAG